MSTITDPAGAPAVDPRGSWTGHDLLDRWPTGRSA